MKLALVAVGQRLPAWAETACEDYLKRFRASRASS
jgi:23S rRNA (pseudouridine1915-N3)-methyltransferase